MVLKRLKSLVSGRSAPSRSQGRVAPEPRVETRLAPLRPFVAIGDIHGCFDLMQRHYTTLRAELGEAIEVVFLGDYADRGPQSAQVLEQLFAWQTASPDTVICLMGNHEKMLLEFIDDPAGKGLRWLVNGGRETLASYGITLPPGQVTADDAADAADAFEAALPDGLEAWLRDLPLIWSNGNIHCVHAAMDPSKPPEAQNRRTLLWGHRDFLTTPRADGQTVVHGHTIMAEPTLGDTRISIDTGAYHSGRLTAALISPGACEFSL